MQILGVSQFISGELIPDSLGADEPGDLGRRVSSGDDALELDLLAGRGRHRLVSSVVPHPLHDHRRGPLPHHQLRPVRRQRVLRREATRRDLEHGSMESPRLFSDYIVTFWGLD